MRTWPIAGEFLNVNKAKINFITQLKFPTCFANEFLQEILFVLQCFFNKSKTNRFLLKKSVVKISREF